MLVDSEGAVDLHGGGVATGTASSGSGARICFSLQVVTQHVRHFVDQIAHLQRIDRANSSLIRQGTPSHPSLQHYCMRVFILNLVVTFEQMASDEQAEQRFLHAYYERQIQRCQKVALEGLHDQRHA